MLKFKYAACRRADEKAAVMGYLAHMAWLEWMSKRYDQKQCERCGFWHIWRRKKKEGKS